MGICDSADCLGLNQSLDGNTCLTQPVECKDGSLVVRSQGTRQLRFSAFGPADFANPANNCGAGPGAICLNPGDDVTVNGPLNTDGSLKMTVSLLNPFCGTANVTFFNEFAAQFACSDRDLYEFGGSVNISGGGATFVDHAPPFPLATDPPYTGASFPTSYGGIGMDTHSGLNLPADDFVISRLIHNQYTVLATIPAGATFQYQAQAYVHMIARGPFRSIQSFNVAVSAFITPAL